jgi:aspartyl-tRNA(Asn)/glutamyl-tRNA(Gln) amidotransferase subunit A
MCEIAIGTDTGGSTRIPASLCGIVGFKPTQACVPLDGAYPLSFALDSVGPMARTVRECAYADAVLAGIASVPLVPRPLRGLQAGIVQGFPLENLDADVSKAFSAALQRLAAAGIAMSDFKVAEFETLRGVNERGGIVPAEAFAIHRRHMAENGDKIDPNIRARIAKGESLGAADFIANMRARADATRSFDDAASHYDFLLMPTTAITAPLQEEVSSSEGFTKLNALLLRNPSWVNFMDACAISLPMRLGNSLPCGLSLVGRRNQDRDLLAIAASIEPLLV